MFESWNLSNWNNLIEKGEFQLKTSNKRKHERAKAAVYRYIWLLYTK